MLTFRQHMHLLC